VLRDALLDAQPLVQQAAETALQELTRGDTVWAAADATRDTMPLPAQFKPPTTETPAVSPAPAPVEASPLEVAP
jgi:hypothetical protein